MKKPLITILGILLAAAILYGLYAYQFDAELKPEDEQTIIALGDSLTYGIGDEKKQGYIGQLQKKLNQQSDYTFTIHNFGIPGQESSDLLEQLESIKVNETFNEADWIIVYIGTNDLRTATGGNFQSISKEVIAKKKELYTRNMDELLTGIQEFNSSVPIIVVGLYNPFQQSNQLNEIVSDWDNSVKDIVQQHKHTHFIPTNDLLEDKEKEDYFSDALHLNHKGYRLIAERIGSYMVDTKPE
ncbi:DUF459 domain-containing protein [Pradoshia sp.]